jgi:hypothetical protein
MTPAEELAVIAAVTARLDEDLIGSFGQLLELIRAGVPPRDAVMQVMGEVQADMAAAIAAGLTAVLEQDTTAADVLRMHVGPMQLSARLYEEATQTAQVVAGMVERHVGGFTDARRLALELFEGYSFRAPDAEPLKFAATNPQLPRYLREVLLTEPGVERALAVHFARLQVNKLSTDGLRAAYSEALAAIAEAEQGVGSRGLEKRLQVAFFERMRYFSKRIAQTEIHRAYAVREALLIMQDTDIEFVQIRRAPGAQQPCVCDLYAGRDIWGLGKGVYPKGRAPLPPFHPFCRCVTAPRLDLTGRKAGAENDEADVYFLRRLDPSAAARVIGSRAKLARVLGGEDAGQVLQQSVNPAYRVRTLAEAN